MKNIFLKKLRQKTAGTVLFFMIFSIINPLWNITFALDSGFTTNETQANQTAGVDNTQIATTATPIANDVGTQSVTTFTVLTAGVDLDKLYLDGCIISFSDGGTPDSDCSDGVGVIDTLINSTTTQQALALAGFIFTNYTSGDGGTDNFVLTHIGTPINGNPTQSTDPGTISVGSTNNTVGIQPVAQQNTITIGGVIEAGDTFIAHLPGSVDASFTATTTSANDVATGLNQAILDSAGYASQDFTSSVLNNVVTLDAKVAGTGFTQTSDATNAVDIQQIVDFIPTNPTDGETFRASINGNNYDYTVVGTKTVAEVVTALQLLMSTETNTTCLDNATKITCSADVAGTHFNFGANIVDITAPIFDSMTVASNNVNSLFAKEGDNLTFTLNTNPADTVGATNSVDFTIGATPLTTNNFSSSSAKITTNAVDYTILAGQDGVVNVSGLTFLDEAGNAITGFISPTVNITVDTTVPVITINSDSSVGPVQSDTINASLTETNPNTLEYGYSTDAVCDGIDTYGNPYISGNDLIINNESNNGKYVCFKAVDMAGNITYQGTTNSLNIDVTSPDVVLSTTETSPTKNVPFSVTATFNEIVNPFLTGVINISNGNISNLLTSDNIVYTFDVTPIVDGIVSIDIPTSITQDLAGNNNNISNTLNVTSDTTAPTIAELTPVPTYSNDITPNYIFTSDEAGLITYSGSCSSVTSSAIIGPNTVTFNTLPEGTYSDCSIIVTDFANNISNTLNVSTFTIDTTSPILTLNGSGNLTQEVGSPYVELGADWTDNVDGTGTVTTAFSGTVDTNTVGVYVLEYKYIDSSTNVSNIVTRTVNIVDTTSPILTLNGSGNLTQEVGSPYVELGADWTDNVDGTGTVTT
ncbi:MAG: DUF5011 domain-containing protein, partial [Candidatus Gracilibacteria bacterium]|nr:DUF5011 domain-containing protein [Candidatus Gracilibacteria bacterium]